MKQITNAQRMKQSLISWSIFLFNTNWNTNQWQLSHSLLIKLAFHAERKRFGSQQKQDCFISKFSFHCVFQLINLILNPNYICYPKPERVQNIWFNEWKYHWVPRNTFRHISDLVIPGKSSGNYPGYIFRSCFKIITNYL